MLTYLSYRIHYVPDSTDLPPPVSQKWLYGPKALAKARVQLTGRLKYAPPRSLSASPSHGASRLPPIVASPPTSIPPVRDAKTQKLQALRTPIIHLLAVRQVSTKFLAQKICCSQQECLEVLQKVGREHRLDSSKWDLSDKSFKELDIWNFAYPQEEDRQFAIDRAVSAFDRMRLSRDDKLWQMLLPKDQRGQGKVLSKLNLHVGPMSKISTPRINLQPTDDSNGAGHETGNDSDKKDRLAPSDAEPMDRSKSNDQIQRKNANERDAQSKRLLSTKPKKVVNPVKTREAQPAAKKGPKKGTSVAGGNVKSTEFVRESDEEEKMEDLNPPQTKVATPNNAKDELKKKGNPMRSGLPNGAIKPKVPVVKDSRVQKNTPKPLARVATKKPPSSAASSESRNRFSDVSTSAAPMTKSLSRQRNTSSPHKPSPLGSSPPTNASDFDNDTRSHHASSTSSTPLITQSHVVKNAPTAIHPRTTQPAAKLVQNTTEHSLKRKANDIDSDIHHHDMALTNGNINPVKRQRSSILSPPTSESSQGDSSPAIHNNTVELAQRFKKFYAKYEQLYQEVSAWQDAPKEKIARVLEMHERLVAMKNEITEALKA